VVSQRIRAERKKESNDETGRIYLGERLSDRFDHTVSASRRRAEVNEQDLVMSGVDDFFELLFQPEHVDRIELALEDGVLDVVAPIAHGFKYLAKPFVVTNIVGDQVNVAHQKQWLGRSNENDPIV
jgi:hypothetical protein